MFDLCKFLNVKEGQEFKINSYRGNYRIMNNHLEILNKDNEWTTNQAIDINDLANCGIRFPRKELQKRLLNLFELIGIEYNWAAKDRDNYVKVFEHRPLKNESEGKWYDIESSAMVISHLFRPCVFNDLSWDDEQPLCINDYVDRY